MSEKYSVDEINEKRAILAKNLPIIRDEMQRHGNGKAVMLAATKTVPVEVINYAIDELHITDIGENRVQEFLEKYDELHREKVNIHFIGRLQTNKVKYIIDKVCLIHSVDSEKLAAEIDRQAKKIGKIMDVLIEVNVGDEESKGGICPCNVAEFADILAKYTNIRIRGIMSIPPACADKNEYIKYFNETNKIFVDILENKLHNISEGILSMGMSDSYIEALDCGATVVRLGRILFGERKKEER